MENAHITTIFELPTENVVANMLATEESVYVRRALGRHKSATVYVWRALGRLKPATVYVWRALGRLKPATVYVWRALGRLKSARYSIRMAGLAGLLV